MSVLKTVITIFLVIVSIILSIVVLMQEGKQEGLGSLAGGASTDTYWSKNKGRSKEGALKKFTTVLAVIFFILALLLNLKWLN